jgi:hypothetical protein
VDICKSAEKLPTEAILNPKELTMKSKAGKLTLTTGALKLITKGGQ